MRLSQFQCPAAVCEARGVRFVVVGPAGSAGSVIGPIDTGDEPGRSLSERLHGPALDAILAPLTAAAVEMDATRLLVWASRRRGEPAACDAPREYSCGSIRHPYDYQRVDDYVFDRELLREALQPLVEDWCPTVRVETTVSPRGPMLRIAWGGWLVSLLDCEGTEAGDDPLKIGGAR